MSEPTKWHARRPVATRTQDWPGSTFGRPPGRGKLGPYWTILNGAWNVLRSIVATFPNSGIHGPGVNA